MAAKYSNLKVKTAVGPKFDSRLELRVYQLLQHHPQVSSIDRQVPLILQEGFRKCEKCGKVEYQDLRPQKCPLCGTAMTKEMPITYIADFKVFTKDHRIFIVEAKGVWTEASRVKMKLFKRKYDQYGLKIIRSVKGGLIEF